jgi:hypothetical protein
VAHDLLGEGRLPLQQPVGLERGAVRVAGNGVAELDHMHEFVGQEQGDNPELAGGAAGGRSLAAAGIRGPQVDDFSLVARRAGGPRHVVDRLDECGQTEDRVVRRAQPIHLLGDHEGHPAIVIEIAERPEIVDVGVDHRAVEEIVERLDVPRGVTSRGIGDILEPDRPAGDPAHHRGDGGVLVALVDELGDPDGDQISHPERGGQGGARQSGGCRRGGTAA